MVQRTLVEAALVAAASTGVALVVNAMRTNGVPLVARTPYEVLVPCPEPGGEVTPMAPDDPAVGSSRTFRIDARTPGEALAGPRLPGAINVPFDWLDPVPDARLAELVRAIATSRATRVVVYGDGGHPDSGEHLGREISGRGIKNVSFVRGGAPALQHEGPR